MFPAASNATLLACSVETPVMVFFNNPSGLYHSTRPSLANATRTSPALGVGPLGLIVSASDWVPVPPALVALRVTVEVPAVVGVPAMSPVVALIVRPAGSPLAPKLVGLLVAVIW